MKKVHVRREGGAVTSRVLVLRQAIGKTKIDLRRDVDGDGTWERIRQVKRRGQQEDLFYAVAASDDVGALHGAGLEWHARILREGGARKWKIRCEVEQAGERIYSEDLSGDLAANDVTELRVGARIVVRG